MVSLFTMFDLSEQQPAEFERERSHNECSGACEFLTLGGKRRQAVTPPLQSYSVVWIDMVDRVPVVQFVVPYYTMVVQLERHRPHFPCEPELCAASQFRPRLDLSCHILADWRLRGSSEHSVIFILPLLCLALA